jgi:hypothetical protein
VQLIVAHCTASTCSRAGPRALFPHLIACWCTTQEAASIVPLHAFTSNDKKPQKILQGIEDGVCKVQSRYTEEKQPRVKADQKKVADQAK